MSPREQRLNPHRPRTPTLRRPAAALALLAPLVGACTSRFGPVSALVGPDAYPPAMVLATGTEGAHCTSAVLRPPPAPELARALAAALATVPEATLLTEAQVVTATLTTGLYNRRCVRVRGSAAKLVSQIVVPAGRHHGGQHR